MQNLDERLESLLVSAEWNGLRLRWVSLGCFPTPTTRLCAWWTIARWSLCTLKNTGTVYDFCSIDLVWANARCSPIQPCSKSAHSIKTKRLRTLLYILSEYLSNWGLSISTCKWISVFLIHLTNTLLNFIIVCYCLGMLLELFYDIGTTRVFTVLKTWPIPGFINVWTKSQHATLQDNRL